jgi:hypothetical protein
MSSLELDMYRIVTSSMNTIVSHTPFGEPRISMMRRKSEVEHANSLRY